MKRATVVIGANFGDEGKGLITDYFAAQRRHPTVVRFNGGAQAGHTVVTPEGRRHVFHHFGAGTLAGGRTVLSRFFIANPILWETENAALGNPPEFLFVDPRALVTTPYDMLINQRLEAQRQGARHGSCGVGINETVERGPTRYSTTVADLANLRTFQAKLEAIQSHYYADRLHQLGLEPDIPSALMFTRFMDVAQKFKESVQVVEDHRAIQLLPNPIFEGAQGLLLDEDHAFFPHVTRSKTGLRNVVTLAKEAGIDGLDITYVTRAYMTRHGAGPFPTEDATLNYADDTNVPHDFQGTLRFGRLDIDLLAASVRNDLKEASDMSVTHGLAITHLDQVPNGSAIVKAVAEATGPSFLYTSHGPRRTDVQKVCENCRVAIQDGTRCSDCR